MLYSISGKFQMIIRLAAGALIAAFAAFTVQSASAADGKALFEEHCAACHVPAADLAHEDFVAPPMFGVMRNYRRAYPDDAQLVEAIAAWVLAPSVQNSAFPAAIQQFGLMLPVEISQEVAHAIAQYVATAPFMPPMMGGGMMGGQGQQ